MRSYFVKRRYLTRHLGSAILDFTIFLKSQEVTEINAISRPNANGILTFIYFSNLMESSGKIENCVIEVELWPDLHEICNCHGNVKCH